MRDPFELIHDNQIAMEEASRKYVCRSCNKKIYHNDIMATNTQTPDLKKLKYHLECFYPLHDTPINEDQINIYVKEMLNKNKIQNWIVSWNWNLRSKNPSIGNSLNSKTQKRFSFGGSASPFLLILGKQNMINVLLFLTTDEIVYIMKIVSKDFYEVCWDPHFWKKLCTRDFTRKVTADIKKANHNVSWVQQYFKLQKSTCFFCKTNKGSDLKSCPIEKKPICRECRARPDFKLLTLEDIKEHYGIVLWHIFSNFIEKYALTCFGQKVFYKRDVENAFKSLQNFASQRE